MKLVTYVRIVIACFVISFAVNAQTAKRAKPKSNLCTQENDVQMINQQLITAGSGYKDY